MTSKWNTDQGDCTTTQMLCQGDLAKKTANIAEKLKTKRVSFATGQSSK